MRRCTTLRKRTEWQAMNLDGHAICTRFARDVSTTAPITSATVISLLGVRTASRSTSMLSLFCPSFVGLRVCVRTGKHAYGSGGSQRVQREDEMPTVRQTATPTTPHHNTDSVPSQRAACARAWIVAPDILRPSYRSDRDVTLPSTLFVLHRVRGLRVELMRLREDHRPANVGIIVNSNTMYHHPKDCRVVETWCKF